MRPAWKFAVVASAAGALLYLLLPGAGPDWPHAAVKVSAIAFLVLFSIDGPTLLTAALGLSLLGDLALAVPPNAKHSAGQLFMIGLVSFLAAHVSYATLFAQNREGKLPPLKNLLSAAPAIAFAATLAVLWPHLGAMKIPVVLYGVALVAMATLAIRSRYPFSTWLGAMLFVASDSMLAYEHFVAPFQGARVLIWSSYWIAQACIAIGVMKHGWSGASAPHLSSQN